MSLPANAHVSTHPCLQAKLSQLRSASSGSRDVQTLVHEIALMIGYEALGATLTAQPGPNDSSPLGYPYPTTTTTPAPTAISLVPILRSGLSMVAALSSLLPAPVPVHHLGLYREKTTLQPVEYYNNLPYHAAPSASNTAPGPADLAIVVDPVIATGATAAAAIETLREHGVKRVLLIAVLATRDGLARACGEWEGVEVWVGGCDEGIDERGMIKPGLGDIGDRLFGTIGK
ncbi:uracil phosphoribosyltransferase-domain-containing protein [Boeremia exigua]|uniref:uracil phosphoribosyltransferase-domain-containing protein n=1 Tax=Boeremia exigua TaxID=749465 RepID=UPI001E8E1B4B|nr:uracil phosphoribosyltransferase-domain-containing protein [Boeremia exigua]KAH6642065.1 uracil phosphoribosyltransferase-domain-containing protein [Boeremia exigua]